MTRLAHFICKHPRKIIFAWILLAVSGAYFGFHITRQLQNGGYGVAGSQSSEVKRLARAHFTHLAEAPTYVAILPRAGSQRVTPATVNQVRLALGRTRHVTSVGTPEYGARDRAALIPLTLAGSLGQAQTYVSGLQKLLAAAQPSHSRVVLIGQTAVYDRYLVNAKTALQQSALISFPVTLVILLIAFLSITAALLPLVLAGACLTATFGALYVLASFTSLSVFIEDTVLILGLGLSIDYSLFMVTRMRECITTTAATTSLAVVETLRTTGRAIVASGVTVAVSLAALFVVDVGFFTSMAIGAIAATVLAMLAGITLTPAVLYLLDNRVNRFPIRVAASAASRGTLWRWLSTFVVRRRIAIFAVLVPTLALLSIPALGLSISFKTFSILPASDPVRQASQEVSSIFGPGAGAPVTVLARGASPTELRQTLAAEAGVSRVYSVAAGSNGWLSAQATLRAAPDSSASEAAIRNLRSRLARQVGPDVLVGGPSAEALDLVDRIDARVIPVVVITLIVELAILLAVFGAPVIAVKAAMTTLLSVGATMGLVTIIFGSSGTVAYFVPLLLFATVFGLSTDYEVFLLSRISEQYYAGNPPSESLRVGLISSSRAITLAGLTMSAVFFAFASSSLVPFRQLGVGMGLAILLDVTIVRGLLVPATVALLGDINWWRPRWLPTRELQRAGTYASDTET
jgi:uncharacterized membrane protein YdfJ with MMPL/SSD domain